MNNRSHRFWGGRPENEILPSHEWDVGDLHRGRRNLSEKVGCANRRGVPGGPDRPQPRELVADAS
jgi:hypothetical protein